MTVESLNDLFVEELQDLYSAENQILAALPEMIAGATAKQLQNALREHQKLTERHVTRLEEIFEAYGGRPARAKKCRGMEGLLKEGAQMLDEKMRPEVRDAAIIAAAQRVEHYEMAGYGCVRTYAQAMGDVETAKLLQATLDEEADADRQLTQLAEFAINTRAARAPVESQPVR